MGGQGEAQRLVKVAARRLKGPALGLACAAALTAGAQGAEKPAERQTPSGTPRTGESLAARFAAKEALAKALGAPGDLHWHDAEVTVGEHGRPHLEVRGTVAGRAAQLGVTSWHLSMSHDGGIASAVVVAEGLGHGA